MSNYPLGAEHHPSAPYNIEENFKSLDENEMAIKELEHLVKRIKNKHDEVSSEFVSKLIDLLHVSL